MRGHIAGLEDPTPVVEFILKNTVDKDDELSSPQDDP